MMSPLQKQTAVSTGKAEVLIKFHCVYGDEVDFLRGIH